MTDPPRTRPLDIAKALAPLRVDTPDLGTMELDIRTTSFLSWLGEGEKTGRWATGPDFLRAFLKERVSRPSAEGGRYGTDCLAEAEIDALDDDALERTAAAVLVAAGPYLRVVQARARDVSASEANQPRASDATDDGRTASTRLRDLASGYLADDRATYKAFAAMLSGEGRQLGSLAGSLVRERELLGLRGSPSSLFGHGSELGRLAELARSPTFQIAETMAKSGIMAQAAAASKLMKGMNRQLTGVARGLTLNPWLEQNSIMALARTDRLAWVRDVNRTLGLGIPHGVAGAIGRFVPDAPLATRAAVAAAAAMRPGYQTVATLALAGSVGRGLAADVLVEYDLTDDGTGELFASAVSCVALLDDDGVTVADRADAIHRFIDAIGRLKGEFGDQIRKAGLVNILALLVAIAAIYPDYRALLDPSDPKPAPELVETSLRLKALVSEMEGEREREATGRERIRYVHAPSPLRAGPDRSAMRLRTVFPDQLVEVRDMEGVWARVAVFDYRTDQEATGWISRRNLHVAPN